ncbi:hypothetical protein [Streptomyces sp. NPDC050485]|uniref:hypothetical protein n=1 Tax=Streptomyces sp. NPDC050485 TaxID=3365617 RepID=UPI0037B1BF5D
MELRIVNPRPEYAPPPFTEPPATGYLHLAAAVEPTLGPTPFPRGGPRKAGLLGRLKVLAAELERQGPVRTVTVYRAVLMPPAPPAAAHPARFDVVVLVEAESPDVLDAVRSSEPYQRMAAEVSAVASDVHEMAARCLRFLGDVDKSRQGLFLFNYFTAEDAEVATRLWEHLAGWYVTETGLDNSTLLAPIGTADYVFVNHARWDMSLPGFALKQFSKSSFRGYVLANLRANRTTAMPILYRKA